MQFFFLAGLSELLLRSEEFQRISCHAEAQETNKQTLTRREAFLLECFLGNSVFSSGNPEIEVLHELKSQNTFYSVTWVTPAGEL